MIEYQKRVFEFSDLGVEFPPVKISLSGFKTEVKTIQTAGESAKALDDFQYQLCRDLENKTLKEQLDKQTWTKYIKTRFAANALLLGFRQTLEAFKKDPERQGKNLDSIIRDIQNLVRSLSVDVDENYNTQAGLEAISAAISKGNLTDEGHLVDEKEVDEFLTSRFEEFEKNQRKILEKVIEVEQTFRESQDKFNKLNLLQSNVQIFTSESKFNPGKKNCWVTGIFTDREIKSGYDARRPITDDIIRSVENTSGTIVYGDPYTGKSILLKRIMFELIQKDYVVLYGDNVESESNQLKEIILNVADKYNKIVFIVDNVHKSSSENVFKVFNEIEPGRVKFLFAAREKQLEKNRDETKVALSDIPVSAQFRIEFNRDYAILLFRKAIDLTFQDALKAKGIEYANDLYDYSEEDALMYNLGLKKYLSEDRKEVGNFIELEMNNIIKKLDGIEKVQNDNIWNVAIFASLIGFLDLQLNLSRQQSLVICSPITLDDLRFLGQEGILLKEHQTNTYGIRHEKFAYEFLSLVYKQRFGNIPKKFDQYYKVTSVIKCIWNSLNADTIIDLLSTCSYLQGIERYNAISSLITSLYVVPADRFVTPPKFTDDEKVRVLCHGLASYYFSMKDYTNCLAYCDKAIEVGPSNLEALMYKGYTLVNLGRYKEAILVYGKALEVDPSNVRVMTEKASALAKLGKNEEAMNYLNRALKIKPEDINVLVEKGGLLLDLEKYEEAIACLDKAMEIVPEEHNSPIEGLSYLATSHLAEVLKDEALESLCNSVKGIAYFDKALEKDPNDVDALSYKGDTLTKLGRHEEGIRLYDKALELDGKHVNALTHKGIALSILNKDEKAITWYDKVLEVDAKNVKALLGKGITLGKLGRYKKAIVYSDKVLEIEPWNVDALCEKVRSLNSLGRYEESIPCSDKVLETDAKNVEVLLEKSFALGNLGRNEEAIVYYDKVLEVDAKNVQALLGKGIALQRLKRYDEALSSIDRALKINPNDSSLLNEKAWTLALADRNKEALVSANESLLIDPKSAPALHTKGYILHNLEKYLESIKWFKKALKFDPSNALALYDKARSYTKINETENALKDLSKAVKLGGQEYITKAKDEKDFDELRDDIRFKEMVN